MKIFFLNTSYALVMLLHFKFKLCQLDMKGIVFGFSPDLHKIDDYKQTMGVAMIFGRDGRATLKVFFYEFYAKPIITHNICTFLHETLKY